MVAQPHSARVTRRREIRALNGSAKSSADTMSGATSRSEPKANATAWNTYPVTAAAVPAHHTRRCSSVFSISRLTPWS